MDNTVFEFEFDQLISQPLKKPLKTRAIQKILSRKKKKGLHQFLESREETWPKAETRRQNEQQDKAE